MSEIIAIFATVINLMAVKLTPIIWILHLEKYSVTQIGLSMDDM
jgi:hypothetical protein